MCSLRLVSDAITILICDLAASVDASVGSLLDAKRNTNLRSGAMFHFMSDAIIILICDLGVFAGAFVGSPLDAKRDTNLRFGGVGSGTSLVPLWASLGLSGHLCVGCNHNTNLRSGGVCGCTCGVPS